MSHFPTTEEEFEMMYGEELEMMNEMDGKTVTKNLNLMLKFKKFQNQKLFCYQNHKTHFI